MSLTVVVKTAHAISLLGKAKYMSMRRDSILYVFMYSDKNTLRVTAN